MKINFQSSLRISVSTSVLIPVLQADGKAQAEPIEQIAKAAGQNADNLHQHFAAKAGECFPVLTAAGTFLLLGLGSKPTFGSVLKAGRQLATKQQHLLPEELTVSWLHENELLEVVSFTEALVNGLLQGAYELGRYKTGEKTTHPLAQPEGTLIIGLAEEHIAAATAASQRGQVIAEVQAEIMALVNAPANYKHPHDIAAWATASAEKHGYRAEVWGKERITKEGMHGLLAVNQGSAEPPAFIIVEYKGKPQGEQLPKIGLVGKGVTFDTGGLSIKPSGNMHYMKSDMGGAAAVLGTLEAAARLQLPVHLVGVVPSTDNSVDALAVKPSDVISSYSGKSIEIIDTDAEGRLVLADGLSYMVRQHQPEILIDLATLTGSSVRTFGYQAAALFSNDDQLAHHLDQAGQQSGERVWRLPLWDEYADHMKSDMADIKNFSGRPVAGAISAAKFLQFFTDEHPSWAHLDIAGVAFGDTSFGSGKAATGYGVRLLVQFMEGLM